MVKRLCPGNTNLKVQFHSRLSISYRPFPLKTILLIDLTMVLVTKCIEKLSHESVIL